MLSKWVDQPMHEAFEQSAVDAAHYQVLRATVTELISDVAHEHDHTETLVLDIAPESHEGARASFGLATIETLDIDASSGATYVADLCMCNCSVIDSSRFDVILCTEVLEHTRYPWRAARELRRLLKPGGLLALTTPFNFRIHGPSPDCWRFTHEGLKTLLEGFSEVNVTAIEDPGRPRMPIQYVTLARKAVTDSSACWSPTEGA